MLFGTSLAGAHAGLEDLRQFADKELLNQFKAIEKMNDKDKGVVKILIDAFITKGKLKQLVL